MSLTVPLAYPAAVPVGHHVELTWRFKPGGLRGNKPTSRPYEPFLIDLDSGVQYAPYWQVGTHDTFRSHAVNDYASEPRLELDVERVVRGRVRSCTVVHIGLSEPYQQTILVIEEDR
jgi:hypothetical protein